MPIPTALSDNELAALPIEERAKYTFSAFQWVISDQTPHYDHDAEHAARVAAADAKDREDAEEYLLWLAAREDDHGWSQR